MKCTYPHILWDFRLFSTAYSNRGVGTFCRSFCRQLLKNISSSSIYIWGNKEDCPEFTYKYPVHWIPYQKSSWKIDLFRIPFLIWKYKIDIFHYWILFGPLTHCGIGLFHPCKTIATVHDLGIDYWNIPFLKSIKKSSYWKTQKLLSKSITLVCTNSYKTKSDCIASLSRNAQNTQVVYMPQYQIIKQKHEKRKPYFITLGGSIHKNSAGVASAFKLFNKNHNTFKLVFLGKLEHNEREACAGSNITFEESMEKYTSHLHNAAALIFCSFFEGFGIPPLEAMLHGCPIIVSNIPSLHETCNDAGIFVSPYSPEQIQNAMETIVKDMKFWSKKSYQGAKNYSLLSQNSINQYINVYESLSNIKGHVN